MSSVRLRAASALAVSTLLAGCATMPTASPVMLGGTEVVADSAVGFIAAGPERGQGPEAVVRGFLLAAQSGPTTPTMFAAARQYLTLQAAHTWRPGAKVLVLDETAALEEVPTEDPNVVIVRASGGVVAQVSSDGIYSESRYPDQHTAEFELHYNGQDWRIAELDDGIIMPAQVFTAAFRYTKLYHPSFDYSTWVPDVRWFPQQTWRTSAVQALLAGPPSFLVDVVQPAVPENAAVTLDEIAETSHGYEIRLRGWLRDADAFNRALFQAQLAMLLTDGSGTQAVDLADSQGPIAVPGYDLPLLPRTHGPAVAVADGELYFINGRDMLPMQPRVDLTGLDITAIAAAPGGADGVVVRNGMGELWWLVPNPEPGVTGVEEVPLGPPTPGPTPDSILGPTAGPAATPAPTPVTDPHQHEYPGDEPLTPDNQLDDPLPEIPPGRTNLLTGVNLIAPSIDNEGLVWTGEATGPIQVLDYLGTAYDVTANWLGDMSIEKLTVAPGGRRVALVTRNEDGTRLLVAGVIRDSQGIPIGLAEPIEVGASVQSVTAVAWQDDSVLAVIGWVGGVRGVYLVGVGGLDAPGGLPRFIPGISEPHWLTASVGTGNMLAIDSESALHLREATSLWPIVGREVTLVAYPG